MPLNCPCQIDAPDACSGCRQESAGRCWWFFPSRPVSDILTTSERLTLLESLPTIDYELPDDPGIREVGEQIAALATEFWKHIEMTTKAGTKAKPGQTTRDYRITE